jgi:hypothetical protein
MGFASQNRGLEMGRPGVRVAHAVKPYLFGNGALRAAIDDGEEVIVSLRGVGDGNALAVVFGLPPATVARFVDAQDEEKYPALRFHEEQQKELPATPEERAALARKRPLRLVNGVHQLLVVREDGTWLVMSREGRARGEKLAQRPLPATPAGMPLASARVDKWMLLDKYPMLGDLRLGLVEVTASLDAQRMWTVAARLEDAKPVARVTCDAVLASLRNTNDPADDLASTRRCTMQGESVVARVRMPAAYTMGLSVSKGEDGAPVIAPGKGPPPVATEPPSPPPSP